MYGRVLYATHETKEARDLLSAFSKDHAPDRQIALLLASIQSETSVSDAIATLRKASQAFPDDQLISDALGEYLLRDHQNAEAATLAQKRVTSEDPNTLNSAAYLLAEANSDLPLAEEKSRKALEILDGQSADTSVSEANARSFQRTSLAVATWDTLGFILLEENKLDEARDYLEASWRNLPSRETGDHYASVLEALGDIKAAQRIYALAQTTSGSPHSVAAEHVDRSLERLKKAGFNATFNAIQILQEERAFKVKFKTPCHSYCSGTFRLQLASGSPLSVILVSGEPALESATAPIKQLRMPHLLPTHAATHILRDAVLSCSAGATTCDFVLMPLGNIAAERIGD